MMPNDVLKFRTFPQVKVVVTTFSLGVALGLLIWSLYNYQPAPNFYGPRAIYSLLILHEQGTRDAGSGGLAE